MDYELRQFVKDDLAQAAAVWNEVVAEGLSFPGDWHLAEQEAYELFTSQTATICLFHQAELVGLYILHPNNIGRCSHIANASYAVKSTFRGRGLGRILVNDSIEKAQQHGFWGLQFNAVVASNYRAISLYLKLGFQIIGTIPNGFRLKDGSYCDTLIFLKSWDRS